MFPGTTKTRRYVVKLSDFGLSAIVSDTRGARLRAGTPWSAPENDDSVSVSAARAKKVDIYMFALLCVWVLFREKLVDLPQHESDEEVLAEYRRLLASNGASETIGITALRNGGPHALRNFVARFVGAMPKPHPCLLSFLDRALASDPDERLSSLEGIELLSRCGQRYVTCI